MTRAFTKDAEEWLSACLSPVKRARDGCQTRQRLVSPPHQPSSSFWIGCLVEFRSPIAWATKQEGFIASHMLSHLRACRDRGPFRGREPIAKPSCLHPGGVVVRSRGWSPRHPRKERNKNHLHPGGVVVGTDTDQRSHLQREKDSLMSLTEGGARRLADPRLRTTGSPRRVAGGDLSGWGKRCSAIHSPTLHGPGDCATGRGVAAA